MRYLLAALLVLGVGITTAIPTALDNNGPGRACYKDGVVSSCTPPPPLYLGTGASFEMALAPTKVVIDEVPSLEIRQAISKPEPQMYPADSNYATSPSNPTPGFDTGYGPGVGPSRPFWVVEFPL
jgi:hypothetical protein